MKSMITWQMHAGKLPDALTQFSQMTAQQDQALMGSEMKLSGRWHDLVRGRGVAIVEDRLT